MVNKLKETKATLKFQGELCCMCFKLMLVHFSLWFPTFHPTMPFYYLLCSALEPPYLYTLLKHQVSKRWPSYHRHHVWLPTSRAKSFCCKISSLETEYSVPTLDFSLILNYPKHQLKVVTGGGCDFCFLGTKQCNLTMYVWEHWIFFSPIIILMTLLAMPPMAGNH